MGRKITIELDEHLSFKNDAWGESVYRENIIRLQCATNGHPRNGDELEQTFFHELMHFIFHVLGKYELRNDEELIEQISGLLHQALVTMEH